MSKINIQKILKKHAINLEPLKGVQNRDGKTGTSYDRINAVFKEIVEQVVDRCAVKANLEVTPHDQETWEVPTKTVTVSELNEHMENGTIEVDKNSILQVKNQIDYE